MGTKNIFHYLSKRLFIGHINKSKKCNISNKADIDKNSIFEGRNVIHAHSIFKNSKIGFASYISSNCFFYKTTIGKYCSIGSYVRIIAGNHPVDTYVSTHPIFYAERGCSGLSFTAKSSFNEYSYADENEKFFCVIGNDVWIGEGARILNGVSIGDGAIIAAGSVVTKNIPPYSIVGGVPAKLIRYRFDESEIDFLLNFQWWNKDLKWLRENIEKFGSIKEFTKRFKC